MSDARPRRAFLHALYLGLRQIQEAPNAREAIQRACERLAEACSTLVDGEGSSRLRVVRRSLYVGEERVEHDIENFVFHRHVLGTLRNAGIGVQFSELDKGQTRNKIENHLAAALKSERQTHTM